MMHRTFPISKSAANKGAQAPTMAKGGSVGQLTQTLRAGQVAVGGALARVKGTVLEAMARGMPENERSFLAERWGFANPAAQRIKSGENVPKFPHVSVAPTTEAAPAVSDLEHDTMEPQRALTADEEMLAKARAAGAAARRAIESGTTIRQSKMYTNGSALPPSTNGARASSDEHGQSNGSGVSKAHEAMKNAGAVSLNQDSTQQALKTEEVPVAKEEPIHPVLGQLVADLDYKRVYRTSIAALVQAPVWEKQRILRPERARAIADAKLKKKVVGMPGVITLFELEAAAEAGSKTDGWQRESKVENEERDGAVAPSTKLGIVDGQHRVGALMLMAERGGWDSSERNVIVDVFRASSERDIADLFTEINRAEPVRLVDMPVEGATLPMKEMLNDVVESLRTDYPIMFKTSARCRPPHVNIDNLRDEIFQSELTERHGLETPDDLRKWLLKVNAMLARRDNAQWAEVAKGYKGMSSDATIKALRKARDTKFFLGMDKSWLRV